MAFEQKHSDLLDKYHTAFGLPAIDADGSAARTWTYQLGSQFNFTFPSEGWGTKSAGGGRPPSTDCLARRTSSALLGYDVIVGQGSSTQHINLHPDELNITGQDFIVTPPVDYLSGAHGPSNGDEPVYPTYEELGGDEGGKTISKAMEADYIRAGRSGLDGGCGAWMQRTVYDYVTGVCATPEESIEKHREEWCAELGIPVE